VDVMVIGPHGFPVFMNMDPESVRLRSEAQKIILQGAADDLQGNVKDFGPAGILAGTYPGNYLALDLHPADPYTELGSLN